jgi:hypothetical protein
MTVKVHFGRDVRPIKGEKHKQTGDQQIVITRDASGQPLKLGLRGTFRNNLSFASEGNFPGAREFRN